MIVRYAPSVILAQMTQVAEFCEANPEISGLAAAAIEPLIREREEEVREKAIETVKIV